MLTKPCMLASDKAKKAALDGQIISASTVRKEEYRRKLIRTFLAVICYLGVSPIYFILVGAAFMPLSATCHACYYTLRAGGKTLVTFLFDSVFVWTLAVPVAYVLAHFTALPIVWVRASSFGSGPHRPDLFQ